MRRACHHIWLIREMLFPKPAKWQQRVNRDVQAEPTTAEIIWGSFWGERVSLGPTQASWGWRPGMRWNSWQAWLELYLGVNSDYCCCQSDRPIGKLGCSISRSVCYTLGDMIWISGLVQSKALAWRPGWRQEIRWPKAQPPWFSVVTKDMYFLKHSIFFFFF